MKAQSGIEMLAMVSVFIALLVPISLYLMSQVGAFSNVADEESARMALNDFKSALERVYSMCPSRETVSLKWPGNIERLSIEKVGNGIRLKMVGTYKGKPYSISDVLALKDTSNLIVDPTNNVVVANGGVITAYVMCDEVLSSNGKFIIRVGRVIK